MLYTSSNFALNVHNISIASSQDSQVNVKAKKQSTIMRNFTQKPNTKPTEHRLMLFFTHVYVCLYRHDDCIFMRENFLFCYYWSKNCVHTLLWLQLVYAASGSVNLGVACMAYGCVYVCVCLCMACITTFWHTWHGNGDWCGFKVPILSETLLLSLMCRRGTIWRLRSNH